MQQSSNQKLPISMDYIMKLATLHEKISALSYKNQDAAIAYLRDWAECRKYVEDLWEEVTKALEEAA